MFEIVLAESSRPRSKFWSRTGPIEVTCKVVADRVELNFSVEATSCLQPLTSLRPIGYIDYRILLKNCKLLHAIFSPHQWVEVWGELTTPTLPQTL